MLSDGDIVRVRMGLAIVPILKVIEKDITDIIAQLYEVIEFDMISVKPSMMNIPDRYFDKTRGQYKAHELLTLITKEKKDDILLGVTMVDLYYPGLNYVFGLAKARDSIISLCRLRQEFYGLKSDRRLFLDRATKEAIHEIGHVLGLAHCRSPNCVMFFSNSIHDTDAKSYRFCKFCSAMILA